jgi:hypothetical protein
MYGMEQVLPGVDPEDFDSDPILEANEPKDSGKIAHAQKLLDGLLVKDVRLPEWTGLCLWRLEQFEDAEAVFSRALWTSPSHNLAVRFLLAPVRGRELWTADGR